MRNRSATGACGFTVSELKSLPDQAITDLAMIFETATRHGFPKHLAQARVAVLANRQQPTSMAHGRPIVIFATLCRLWASTTAKSILRHWSKWMPWEVRGCLPNREARDISFALECLVEQALYNKQALTGFSIDIVKCFNQIPRLPLRKLLSHLGMPGHVLSLWFDFLAKTERCPSFHGCMGTGLPSTTGVPEGDPLSVVAMVGLCWLAVHRTRPETGVVMTYVDNFSWVANDQTTVQQAFQQATSFCKAWSLPIDWSKSFAWATTKRLQQWWDTTAQDLLPAGTALTRVDSAKDLGVSYRFRKGLGFKDLGGRLEEGFQRLRKLAKEPRPVDQKSRLVQGGVWPQCLYGQEGQLLPLGLLERLRSAAARAVWGNEKALCVRLSMATGYAGLQDPEVYLLHQALHKLQRLLRTWPQLGRDVLGLTIHERGRPYGPATSLARLLARNDWSLQADAKLKGPSDRSPGGYSKEHPSDARTCLLCKPP